MDTEKKRLKTPFRSLRKHLSEAVSGVEHDYTNGSLRRAIFLLAVPMVLEMIMESIFGIVDIYFVGKLGASAVATVGLTESMMSIIFALAMGLAVAASATVSRRVGEKNPHGASKAAFQAMVLGVLISVAITYLGLFHSNDLLRLMGASAVVIDEFGIYTQIILSTNVVIVLLFVINAVFRGAGNASISMRVLWFANILNIILDPILIHGIGTWNGWGIEGAAWATTIGRGAAVLYQLYILTTGKQTVRLRVSVLKIDFVIIRRLLVLASGSIGQSLIATTSWVALTRIVAEFGDEVLAGYTISIRIILFTLLPAWGLANAAATLIGQNLGARKPRRAERSAWITGRINAIVLGSTALLLIVFPDAFIGFFTNQQNVVNHGSVALRIISLGFVAYSYGMVLMQSLNGAGDTRTPFFINMISFWGIEMPGAYFFGLVLGYGVEAVYVAIVASETIMTVLAFYFFGKGKWKRKHV